jgi:DnaJ-class molecular chaperone
MKENRCNKCDGDKMIQSENGNHLEVCSHCEGSGLDKQDL